MCVSDIAGVGLPILIVLTYGEVVWWAALLMWLYFCFVKKKVDIILYIFLLVTIIKFHLQKAS